jgi:hypothetical protein
MREARRLSSWRILGRCTLGLALAAGLYLGWLEWATSRAWAALVRQIDAQLDEACAHTPARVLLRPAEHPGNAWDDYVAATAPLGKMSYADEAFLLRFLDTDDADQRGHVQALLRPFRPCVDLLARGARRADWVDPDRRGRLLGKGASQVRRPDRMVLLAIAEARLAADRGNAGETVSRIADVLQFARDAAENAGYTDVLAYSGAIRQSQVLIGHLLAAGRLEAAHWETIERLLARLESSASPGEILQLAGVRHLFSRRRFSLSYWADAADCVRELQGCDAWSAADLKKKQTEGYIRDGSWNPKSGSLQNATLARLPAAYLRVLRAGLAWALRGEHPAGADPYGDALHAKVESDRLTVWSNGMDFTDDGGNRRDLVMRVRRRAP